MVKFSVFGSAAPKPQKKSIDAYKEIAQRLLSSGKTQAEVAAYLKSQGLDFGVIDKIMNDVIKSAVSSPTPVPMNSTPATPKPPSLPVTQPSPQSDINEVVDKILEKLIVEMESIVDLVIEKKYGNIKKDIKEIKTMKESVESIEENMAQKINEIKNELEKHTKNLEKEIEELKRKIEDIEPKINALESAFKDNIPNIIDDLRKIEKIVEEKYGGEEKPILSYSQTSKEEEKSEEKEEEKEEKSYPEFKIDDLIN